MPAIFLMKGYCLSRNLDLVAKYSIGGIMKRIIPPKMPPVTLIKSWRLFFKYRLPRKATPRNVSVGSTVFRVN